MVIVRPVHSVVSNGFDTLRYSFHRVYHMVADCFYLLWILEHGNLGFGKGRDALGHEGDMCQNCEFILIEQYGYNQLASIKGS